jgi:D-proline reductase (dithiol) PrdB
MARLSDLQLKHRAIIQAYPFRRLDWHPGAKLAKPLREARIALVTTAGLYLPGQTPFRHSLRHDDCSYREIPADTPIETLRIGQSSDAFDHAGIEKDRNLAFPLDRLRELVEEGAIGQTAPRHFSLMGSILAPGALIRETGPEIARKFHEDGVDAVLLVPV